LTPPAEEWTYPFRILLLILLVDILIAAILLQQDPIPLRELRQPPELPSALAPG
jgi:hypothetical protein